MAVAESERVLFQPSPAGIWRLRGWAPSWVSAGMTDRTADRRVLLAQWSAATRVVEAQQVHGASLAVIRATGAIDVPIAGCDALLTDVPGTALFIRTADCLPIFMIDPIRRAVGIAHVGWRGLAAQLPLRLIGALRHTYHSAPEELRAAIGPAIHACCYEVGPEFEQRFGRCVQQDAGRRTCDLIRVVTEQLTCGGIRQERITDSQLCTASNLQQWFSLRREGPSTGRMLSFIMIHS